LADTEKVRIRGLARVVSGLFGLWGTVVAVKAVYDLFVGEPEANLYAPQPWQFVTKEQWLRWGGFELVYGLACLGLAFYVRQFARWLPEFVVRPRQEADELFG
jgi:hypothetical protein